MPDGMGKRGGKAMGSQMKGSCSGGGKGNGGDGGKERRRPWRMVVTDG